MPSLRLLALSALLAAPHMAFAAHNPPPANCCECITTSIFEQLQTGGPNKPLIPAAKENTGHYTFSLKADVKNTDLCDGVYITKITLVPIGSIGDANHIKVYPPDGTESAPPIKHFSRGDVNAAAGTPEKNPVTIPGDKARAAKTNLWKVVVECSGSTTNEPCSSPFTVGNPGEFGPGITIGGPGSPGSPGGGPSSPGDHQSPSDPVDSSKFLCKPCQEASLTASPTGNNACFSYDIPIGSTKAGEATGTLRFLTPDLTNPGIAGLGAFVPTSFVVIRDNGNLLTKVQSDNAIIEFNRIGLDSDFDPNAFTITHKHAAAPSAVFRTTTISRVIENGITYLRADSTFANATFRYQQSLVKTAEGVSPAVDTYTLKSGPVEGTNFNVMREETLVVTYNPGGTQTHRETVMDDGVTVSVIETIWQEFAWGWEKTQQVINPGGANLTSNWTYFTGESSGLTSASNEGYGLLKSFTRYDGYSENHYYWLNTQLTLVPFDGVDSEGKPNCLTISSVWNSGTITTTRTVSGKILSTNSEMYDPATNTIKEITWPSLTTTTTLMPYGAEFGGQPSTVSHPDGTVTIYTYELSGGIKTVTMSTGTTTAGQSTVAIYNSHGKLKKETVTDTASGVVLSVRDALFTDLFGRVTKWAYDNDPDNDYSETTYGCCDVDSERSRDGTVTTYFRDGLKRLLTSTTTLGTRSTITGYTYSVTDSGQPLTVVSSSANGLSAGTTSTIRDLAGRTVFVTSPGPEGANETTSYANSGNGLTITTTNPDGGTVITESLPDGKTKSISGSATIRSDYSYETHEVAGGGLKTTVTTAQGVGGVQTSYADLAGRVFMVESSAPDGGTATTVTAFNNKGQVDTVTSSGQPAVGYVYDSLGVRTETWTNRNGDADFNDVAVTINGMVVRDSKSKSVTDYLASNNAPTGLNDCRRTRAWVRLDSNEDVLVSTSYQSVDGLRSLTTSIGVDGATTTYSTRPLNGAWTSTTTYPDTTSAVSVTTMLDGGLQKTVTTRKDSASATLEATATVSDSLGRTSSTTSGRGHVTNYEYFSNGGQVEKIIQINAGPGPSNLVTSYNYSILAGGGRRSTIILADGTGQYRETNTLGQSTRQWGSQTNPVTYGFDAAGRMTEQTTYRAVVEASADTFPAVDGDTTRWVYHASGELLEKEYPGGKKTTYTHDVAGRMLTRTWARDVSATYSYLAGQLTGIDYSDATAHVTFTYDRIGRTCFVAQGSGTTANTSQYLYNDNDNGSNGTLGAGLGLYSETITYGAFGLTRTILRHEDSRLRPTGWDLKTAPDATTSENIAIYGYNSATGRLETVGNNLNSFTYGFVSSSFDLLETVTGPAHTVTNTYEDHRDVLLTKANTRATDASVVSSIGYNVNKIGQRTKATRSGAATNSTDWGYDSLGQLVSADDDTSANDRFYQFDTMGNRKQSRIGTATDSGGTLTAYFPTADATTAGANALNQYGKIASLGVNVIPQYDFDGNMTSGPIPVSPSEARTLVWDGENRLAEVKIGDTSIVKYAYDATNRRIAKTTGGVTTLYLLDGWNVIAEYSKTGTATPVLTKTYLWGLDLSGSHQGAGGVGGLLAVSEHSLSGSTPVRTPFYPTFDGNGNVSEYLNGGSVVKAHYEYDPFGNTVASSGDKVADFSHRFSTKYLDTETGLYYYGYRYYDPLTGRWPSRDPIDEKGGMNLYGFVRNDGVDRVDYLGWWTIGQLMHETFGPIPPPIRDGVERIDVLRITWQCKQWGETFVKSKRPEITGQRLEYKGNGIWEPFATKEMVEDFQVIKDWGYGAEVSDYNEAVRLARVALDNVQITTKAMLDHPAGTVLGQNQGQGDLYNPHCTKRCYKR